MFWIFREDCRTFYKLNKQFLIMQLFGSKWKKSWNWNQPNLSQRIMKKVKLCSSHTKKKSKRYYFNLVLLTNRLLKMMSNLFGRSLRPLTVRWKMKFTFQKPLSIRWSFPPSGVCHRCKPEMRFFPLKTNTLPFNSLVRHSVYIKHFYHS